MSNSDNFDIDRIQNLLRDSTLTVVSTGKKIFILGSLYNAENANRYFFLSTPSLISYSNFARGFSIHAMSGGENPFGVNERSPAEVKITVVGSLQRSLPWPRSRPSIVSAHHVRV